jgi:hypothetical protein
MKRNPDLIRALLLKFESRDDWLVRSYNQIKVDGLNASQIRAHVALMLDAGLVTPHKALKKKDSNKVEGKIRRLGALRLTNAGYDFLDSVRDDEIWRKTKKAAKEARGFTFDLLVDLAKGFVKTKIEEHTGVKL